MWPETDNPLWILQRPNIQTSKETTNAHAESSSDSFLFLASCAPRKKYRFTVFHLFSRFPLHYFILLLRSLSFFWLDRVFVYLFFTKIVEFEYEL